MRYAIERVLILAFVWLGLVLAAMTCAGCGLEALDGEASDPADCCWFWPNDSAVASCIRDSVEDLAAYDTDEDGCVDVVCHPNLGGWHVLVCPVTEESSSDPAH